MSNRKRRRFVLPLLLVMLAAAAFNTWHVFHIQPDDVRVAMEARGQDGGAGPQGAGPRGARGYANPHLQHNFSLPTWGGTIDVKEAAGGGYDITLTAAMTGGQPVGLTGCEVTLTPPGDGKPVVPGLSKTQDGKCKGHADLPAKGEWKADVRLHRTNDTFEFPWKFTVK